MVFKDLASFQAALAQAISAGASLELGLENPTPDFSVAQLGLYDQIIETLNQGSDKAIDLLKTEGAEDLVFLNCAPGPKKPRLLLKALDIYKNKSALRPVLLHFFQALIQTGRVSLNAMPTDQSHEDPLSIMISIQDPLLLEVFLVSTHLIFSRVALEKAISLAKKKLSLATITILDQVLQYLWQQNDAPEFLKECFTLFDDPKGYRKLFREACFNQAFSLMQYFLARGFDPNQVDTNTGNTIAHELVIGGFVNSLEVLLNFPVDLTKVNKNGMTAFDLASAQDSARASHIIMRAAATSYFAGQAYGSSSLSEQACFSSKELEQSALKHQLEMHVSELYCLIESNLSTINLNGMVGTCSLLIWALTSYLRMAKDQGTEIVLTELISLIELLLKQRTLDPNVQYAELPLLIWLIQRGADKRLLETVLKCERLDVNWPDLREGCTSVHWAIKLRQPETLRLLCHRSDTRLDTLNHENKDPLQTLLSLNIGRKKQDYFLTMLNLLLDDPRCPYRSEAENMKLPEGVKRINPSADDIFYDMGSLLEAPGEKGLEKIRQLLQEMKARKIPLDQIVLRHRPGISFTVSLLRLMMFRAEGREYFDLLFKEGVKFYLPLTLSGQSALHLLALSFGLMSEEKARCLLSYARPGINFPDQAGLSPLFDMVNGDYRGPKVTMLFNLFLEHGADINAQNRQNESLLEYSLRRKRLDIAHLALQKLVQDGEDKKWPKPKQEAAKFLEMCASPDAKALLKGYKFEQVKAIELNGLQLIQILVLQGLERGEALKTLENCHRVNTEFDPEKLALLSQQYEGNEILIDLIKEIKSKPQPARVKEKKAEALPLSEWPPLVLKSQIPSSGKEAQRSESDSGEDIPVSNKKKNKKKKAPLTVWTKLGVKSDSPPEQKSSASSEVSDEGCDSLGSVEAPIDEKIMDSNSETSDEGFNSLLSVEAPVVRVKSPIQEDVWVPKFWVNGHEVRRKKINEKIIDSNPEMSEAFQFIKHVSHLLYAGTSPIAAHMENMEIFLVGEEARKLGDLEAKSSLNDQSDYDFEAHVQLNKRELTHDSREIRNHLIAYQNFSEHLIDQEEDTHKTLKLADISCIVFKLQAKGSKPLHIDLKIVFDHRAFAPTMYLPWSMDQRTLNKKAYFFWLCTLRKQVDVQEICRHTMFFVPGRCQFIVQNFDSKAIAYGLHWIARYSASIPYDQSLRDLIRYCLLFGSELYRSEVLHEYNRLKDAKALDTNLPDLLSKLKIPVNMPDQSMPYVASNGTVFYQPVAAKYPASPAKPQP